MWTEHDRQLILNTKKNYPRWNWERIYNHCKDKLEEPHSSSSCRKMYQRAELDPEKTMTPLPLWDRRSLAKMVFQEPRPSWKDIAKSLGYSAEECKNCYKYHLTENELDRGRREAMMVVMPSQAAKATMMNDASPSPRGSPSIENQKGKVTSEKSREHSLGTSSSKNKDIRNDSTTSQRSSSSSSSVGINNGSIDKKPVSPSSSQTSKNSAGKWKTRDECNLLRYRARHMPWNDISEKLDRSVASCKSKYESLMEESDEESD
ncbi:hypothetical protein BDB00DRAFT_943354 [Zychaea mexicana]|uniref:uncharacterized protein n=1 Tax=Zychaea mexicana TaxID=64656 RepID=UPI0022FEC012|nr:uncharacterized protein BDB00DRAFT_943354 [Zychaea mexicana]KAI9479600.1 hypothetical protein BDB00DRAFT_943354 [Zychaea mexicana]